LLEKASFAFSHLLHLTTTSSYWG